MYSTCIPILKPEYWLEFSFRYNFSEIYKYSRDEQPTKAKLPIYFTEEGINISLKEEHPLKQLYSIDSREEGIEISLRFVQRANDEAPREITDDFSTKETTFNAMQLENVSFSIKDEQPLKEPSPIELTRGGILISFNDEQWPNAFDPIESNDELH